MTAVVTRPRSDFVASGGAVAFDRLQFEISAAQGITVPLLGSFLTPSDPVNAIDLLFETKLDTGELAELDAIIAAHQAINLPLGSEFLTSHSLLALPAPGLNLVSFVDDTFALIGAITPKNQRLAVGNGFLRSVSVQTSIAADVTVQRIGNGAPSGAGTTLPVPADTPTVFRLPLDQSLFSAGDSIGVGLSGLAVGSNTCVDAVWEETT